MDVGQLVKDYKFNAEQLESQRLDLSKKVSHIIREEIIPAVTPFLPKGYSISAEHSGLSFYREGHDEDSVKTKTFVELRLRKDGKPLSYDDGMGLQQLLKEPLKQFKDKYGFDEIHPMGEPSRTG